MKTKTNVIEKAPSGNIIRTILRQELQNIKTGIVAEIETNVDFKLGKMETRIDEKAKEYRDEILTSNDKLMKELEEQREEREIGDSQIRKRLNILESA